MTMTGTEAAEAERAVMDAQQRWLSATMVADADTLEGLLADGYTYTHATTAQEDTREEWLESFRSGGRIYGLYAIEDTQARVFPGTVVLTGASHQHMGPTVAFRELHTRFLAVWVQQDGAWKLAGWQATEIPGTRVL